MNTLLSIVVTLQADNSGFATAVFRELRSSICGGSSGIHHVCLGICSLFCIIAIVKIVADIMQDKEGGFGNVPLGRIFRPFLIMSLLVGYTLVIKVVDQGAGYLGGGAEATYKAPTAAFDKLDSSYDKAVEQYRAEREQEYESVKTDYTGIGEKLVNWIDRKWFEMETSFKAPWHGFMGFCYELPGFIAEFAFAIVMFIMMAFAEIQLTVMAVYGQIALTFSVLTPWKQAFTGFLGKYITVSLWRPILAIIASSAAAVTPAIGGAVTGQAGGGILGGLAAALTGCCVYLAAIHMAFNVGQIANDVYNLGSAGGAAGSGASAVGKKMKML